MTTLLVFQPYLASYRVPLLRDLGKHFETTLISSPSGRDSGFGEFDLEACGVRHRVHRELKLLGGRLIYQSGTVAEIARHRPQAILLTDNPRYLNYLAALFVGRLLGIRVFLHGHGLYKHPDSGPFRRTLKRLMTAVSTAYISYGKPVSESLTQIGVPGRKIEEAPNTLECSATLPPDVRSGDETDILFIGRLRPQSSLELLAEAVSAVRSQTGTGIGLQVVGGGELEAHYRKEYERFDWVHFHGPVFDDEGTAEIAKTCFAGCHPGAAGLSVVHLMSLSLPVVVHDHLAHHMGPEAAYVVPGHNGSLFREGDAGALAREIERLLRDREYLRRLQRNAYETYVELNRVPLGEKIATIIQNRL